MADKQNELIADDGVFVTLKVPQNWVTQLDEMAREQDTDRSKLIRTFIRKECSKRQRKQEAQYQNTSTRVK